MITGPEFLEKVEAIRLASTRAVDVLRKASGSGSAEASADAVLQPVETACSSLVFASSCLSDSTPGAMKPRK